MGPVVIHPPQPKDPDISKYCFIDGRYLWETLKLLRGETFDYDGYTDYLEKIPGVLGHYTAYFPSVQPIRRTFYYDCIDDRVDTEARRKQEQFLESVENLQGFHVLNGVLRQRRRARSVQQKEVDVQLAVDMMSNAYAGNMAVAFLIAGDLDFRPVVENLVHSGVYVIVVGSAQTTARELIAAADDFVDIAKLIPPSKVLQT